MFVVVLSLRNVCINDSRQLSKNTFYCQLSHKKNERKILVNAYDKKTVERYLVAVKRSWSVAKNLMTPYIKYQ